MALHPQRLDYASICAGGGGLDLGIELACPIARPVLYVEREAFAAAHLVAAIEAGLLAPAPVWSDARTAPGRRFRGCLDLLAGGIPCQPHSVAGKRLAELDERDLWKPFRRFLIQSAAWAVLIENVGGMLSSGGAERVWRDLRRLGFHVEGGLFTAAEVGASHRRERLFILGVADGNCIGWAEGHGGRSEDAGRSELADGGGALADANVSVLCGQSPAGEFALLQQDDGHGGGLGPRHVADADRAGSPVDPCWGGYARQEFAPALGGGRDLGDADGARADFHAAAGGSRGATGEPGGHVGDASSGGRAGWPESAVGGPVGRAAAERPVGRPLFPPGPGDTDGWRAVLERWPEVEPAVRGMADGLAAGVDLAGLDRIDRLRLLGNGVVSLEGGYALRTLAARAASNAAEAGYTRAAARAAHLVRLMGADQ